jgi:hypothetical protein
MERVFDPLYVIAVTLAVIGAYWLGQRQTRR